MSKGLYRLPRKKFKPSLRPEIGASHGYRQNTHSRSESAATRDSLQDMAAGAGSAVSSSAGRHRSGLDLPSNSRSVAFASRHHTGISRGHVCRARQLPTDSLGQSVLERLGSHDGIYDCVDTPRSIDWVSYSPNSHRTIPGPRNCPGGDVSPMGYSNCCNI